MLSAAGAGYWRASRAHRILGYSLTYDTNLNWWGSFMTLRRKVLSRLFGEAYWVRRQGDFRTRERYGLISRPNYLYGMLRASDLAKYFGHKCVTVVEFGVASGAGLLNMVSLAPQISEESGIDFRIVGFDTGRGLPPVHGYKDHPEL